LLKSFYACNVYNGPHEWIISDYGSTDGTREFLVEHAKNYPNVTLLFGNENAYIERLNILGFQPANRRQRAHAMFGLFRNEIKNIAKGDLFITIADDHQFIRKGDWINDALSIVNHRQSAYKLDDISSIIYRGLSLARINKKNNETNPIEQSKPGCEYFVAIHKCYDDYHIQHKEMYKRIGKYLEVDKIEPGHDLDEWRAGSDRINHYEDYLKRTKRLNLRKVFMKYPYVIDFPNPWHNQLNKPMPNGDLIVPLIPSEQMISVFSNLNRPVSTDEILRAVNS
jgi:glycosyltransferase involved in cell wall biosynthesis